MENTKRRQLKIISKILCLLLFIQFISFDIPIAFASTEVGEEENLLEFDSSVIEDQQLEELSEVNELIEQNTKELEDASKAALGITAVNTDKPSPQSAGTTIRIKPTATGSGSLTYKFWVLKEGTGKWDVVQDFSSKDYYDWKPTENGTYRLWVDVKDSTGNMVSKWVYFDVKSTTLGISAINTDKPSPQSAGTTIRIKPTATGLGNLTYKFWVLKEGTGQWNVVQDFSSKDYYDWKPTENGTYRLWVDVKDSTGNMVSKWVYFDVKSNILGISAINTDRPSPQPAGTTIRVKPAATGSGSLTYRFWVLKEGTGQWNVVQDFSSKDYYDWKPTENGTYRLFIDVKDSTGNMVSKWVYFDVKGSNLGISAINTDKPSPQPAGTTIRVKPAATGSGNLTYRFWVLKEGTGQWNVVQDFSSKDYYDWKPTENGTYRLFIDVKDSTGNMVSKWVYFDVKGSNLGISAINTDKPSPQPAGTTIRVKPAATGSRNLTYRFWVLKEGTGQWNVVQDFSSKDYYDWKPTENGTYRLFIDVKDSTGNMVSKWVYFDVKGSNLGISAINTDKPSPQPADTTIRVKPAATGSGNLTYRFWVLKEGTGQWNVVQDFSSKNYYDWKPTEDGTYRLFIDVKDSTGNMVSKWVYFDVKGSNLAISAINTDKPSPQDTNTTIRISPKATGMGALTYKFWILEEGTGKWDVVQDFSSKNYFDWKPTKSASYRLWVDVKDSTGTMVSKWVSFKINAPLELKNIKTDKPSPQFANTLIRILPEANGTGTLSYKFWILEEGTGQWNVVQDFSSKNYFDWKPSKAATYRLWVDVKDSTGKVISKWVYYDVSNPLSITSISTDKPSPQLANSNIRITPKINGGLGNLSYKFWVLEEGTGKWDVVQDFSSKNYYDWKPAKAATYRLWVDAKDSAGNTVSKVIFYTIEGQVLSTGYVNASGVNVRSGAGTNFPVLGTLGTGDSVEIIDKSNPSWHQIKFKGGVGYIHKDYVSFNRGLDYFVDIQFQKLNQTDKDGYWRNATRDEVKYYMDPNNFIGNEGKYMFMKLNYSNSIPTSAVDDIVAGKGILSGKGSSFVSGGQKYNVNPLYLAYHARLETGNGTSTLSTGVLVRSVGGVPVEPKIVYNMFGIGAFDGDPDYTIRTGAERAYKEKWFTPETAIIEGAKWIGENYINNPLYYQDTLYKMRWNLSYNTVGWHQYATDIGWAYKQSKMMSSILKNYTNYLEFEIPVFN